jgi:transcriptional regulator
MKDATSHPPHRRAVYVAQDAPAIVRAYPFATLISTQLHAAFAPIVMERDDSDATLVGHLPRRSLAAQAMRDGERVLAIFSGPHAYISPRWYVEKPEVPTWDYVAALVWGRLDMVDDDAGQEAILRRTTELVEAGFDAPWTIDDAQEGRVPTLLPLIRSFRIHIETIEATTKLSQTHPEADRLRMIAGLRAQSGKTIADLIEAQAAP